MARKSPRKRTAPRRRTIVRTVTRWRSRAAKAARRGRRRGGSRSAGGLPFRAGRNVFDTVKINLPAAAGLALATTAGAMGAGYAARKIAPRLRNNYAVVGGVLTLAALLVGAAARKIAGKAGGAVGPKAVAFASLGAATYGLSTTANAMRARMGAGATKTTAATLPAGGVNAAPPRSSAEAIAQLA